MDAETLLQRGQQRAAALDAALCGYASGDALLAFLTAQCVALSVPVPPAVTVTLGGMAGQDVNVSAWSRVPIMGAGAAGGMMPYAGGLTAPFLSGLMGRDPFALYKAQLAQDVLAQQRQLLECYSTDAVQVSGTSFTASALECDTSTDL